MKIATAAVVSLGLMLGTAAAQAVDSDAVIGGAIGGGVGAAIGSELGGRNGAIAGGAVGAAVGTAIATDGNDGHDDGRVYYGDGYDRGGPPPHAYREPPGHAKHRKHKH
ncbi:MAG: hypothetical protein LOY58_10805 [Gammaproteobacteria bacterium]|nr:hypothetical protein [Gammaproteobacteria bacterium]